MDYKRCKICKDWHWTNKKCLPEYLVYHEDYMGEEPHYTRAHDHESAALKYGEYYNQNDYSLMEETIEVKVEKDGEIKYFSVGAEPDIHYSANEINALTLNQTTND